MLGMNPTHRPIAAFLLLAAILAGCAAPVPVEPANLVQRSATASPAAIQIAAAKEVLLPTGYRRTLPINSRWQHVGAIRQGAVYRPVDGVFSIEGRHTHEAYLVVAGGTLQGFYLPAESAFSPLPEPVSLSLGALK